jgi:hypothetical protein
LGPAPGLFDRRTATDMATTRGNSDRRAGYVVGAAFMAGVVFAVIVCGQTLWDPPAEPYFGMEEAFVEAERPPVAIDDYLPAYAALLTHKTQPPKAAAAPHPAPRTALPERLALGDAAAPIVMAVVSQALPTSGRDEMVPPAVPEPPALPPSVGVEEPLLPTPRANVDEKATDSGVVTSTPAPEPALRALISRLQPEATSGVPIQSASDVQLPAAAVAAPLPGAEWNDPDDVNWSDSPDAAAREPAARGGRLLGRLVERRNDSRGEARGEAPTAPPVGPPGGRLLDRMRDRLGQRESADQPEQPPPTPAADGRRWPNPGRLIDQLERLRTDDGAGPAGLWAEETLRCLTATMQTAGPRDNVSAEPLIALGDRVPEGMRVADETADAALASQIRRAALAVSRRVAVWRAAASLCAEIGAGPHEPEPAGVAGGLAAACTIPEIVRLLHAIERFESSRAGGDAAAVRGSLRAMSASPLPGGKTLDRAVHDHYLSPNVRIVINEQFVEKMLPETNVTTSPLQDFVLGRKVRGTKTVEQSTGVRFAADPGAIRLELLVNGEVTSRTVTEAGAVAIHSHGLSTFTVAKPIQVTPAGLVFGAARGSASNQSRLANIETSFDAVPLMGPLVRGIVRNQHDGSIDEANREVNTKIVSRACREVDQQTEPQLTAVAERIRERFWMPMQRLGLEPTAVSLETTGGAATARLRLAAATQLAAHTPRPRPPEDALISMQVHESSVNNACGQFGLAGRKMSLEELARFICKQLGLPAQVPDDLPAGVDVTFAATDPLRVECRDGLVHVRITLDALESGRRNNWYDIVAQVAYRPTPSGMQVSLEREGPVQLSGPGHKGRMEFGLRTIFGKMFPKERPVTLVPEKVLTNPRLAGVQAVQAVSADGWLAIALAATTQAGGAKAAITASRPDTPTSRLLSR